MPKLAALCMTAGLVSSLAFLPVLAADGANDEGASIPKFGPDTLTAWVADRPASDDFLPPESGPGPVLADPAHPYVPNGSGQPTYRVADLTNPILKPWVVEQMKKTNDDVLAGKGPYIAREPGWAAGAPGSYTSNPGQPIQFLAEPHGKPVIPQVQFPMSQPHF